MSLSHKIAWNTLIQIIGKSFSAGLGVLITILLTRHLGPAGFGTYTFVLVFVTMFGTLADWGLTLITVREASRNDALAREIIGNVLVIRLGLAFIAAIITVLVIYLLPYDPQIRLLVSVASLMLLALSLKTSFQIIFNVKLQMQNWALSEIAGNALFLALLLFLIQNQTSLLMIILAFVLSDSFAAGVAAFLGFKLLPLKYSLIHPKTRFLLIEAIPMGGILVVFTIYNRIDTVILSLYKGQEAVGLYGASYKVYEVLVLGAAYFANSVLPLISQLAISDKFKLGDVYRKSFIILLIMGVAVAVANYIFAPLAINIIAGPDFAGSIGSLRILSLAIVVSYFNHINGYTIVALGKQWASFLIACVALAINVFLNIVFIPLYSFYAASFITFITEALIVVLSLYVLRRDLGRIPGFRDFRETIGEIVRKRGQIF